MRPRAKKSTPSHSRSPRFSIPLNWPEVPRCEHPGCDRFGSFGIGRSLLRDIRGRTFCRLHEPKELP